MNATMLDASWCEGHEPDVAWSIVNSCADHKYMLWCVLHTQNERWLSFWLTAFNLLRTERDVLYFTHSIRTCVRNYLRRQMHSASAYSPLHVHHNWTTGAYHLLRSVFGRSVRFISEFESGKDGITPMIRCMNAIFRSINSMKCIHRMVWWKVNLVDPLRGI